MRMLIQVPPELGPVLRVSLASLLGSFNVAGLAYAFYGMKTSMDIAWTDLPITFVGAFIGGFGPEEPSRGVDERREGGDS